MWDCLVLRMSGRHTTRVRSLTHQAIVLVKHSATIASLIESRKVKLADVFLARTISTKVPPLSSAMMQVIERA